MSSRIVLLGLPGAGKGTVGPSLAETLGFTFISLGDEVRRLAKAESLPVTDLIVHLSVSEETSTQRVLGRGREGDGLEKLLARLNAERERLLPLLEYCRQHCPVIDIDANPLQEAVWQELWKEVRKWKN